MSVNATLDSPDPSPSSAEVASSATGTAPPPVDTAAVRPTRTAMAATVVATTRWRCWWDHCRTPGDTALPTALPMQYAGYSSAATHPIPRPAQMNGSTTATLLSWVPAL